MKKVRDHYFHQAKKDNYPARSVYKLKEIDKRFGILKAGQHVLDLGAAPGSWSLFAAQRVGSDGRVLSVDLQDAPELSARSGETILFLQEDIYETSGAFQDAIDGLGPFHVVISDMAPKTSGVKFADQARSHDLAMNALELACKYLRLGGHFVVKVFMGPDTNDLAKEMRNHFETVKCFKPKSSRAESKETFYVGMCYRSTTTTE